VRDLVPELLDDWVGVARHGETRLASGMATNGSPELLIVMGPEATPDQTDHVVARLEDAGVDARVSRGREATVVGAIGDRELLATLPVEGYPGVEQVVPIIKPYRLAPRALAAAPARVALDTHTH